MPPRVRSVVDRRVVARALHRRRNDGSMTTTIRSSCSPPRRRSSSNRLNFLLLSFGVQSRGARRFPADHRADFCRRIRVGDRFSPRIEQGGGARRHVSPRSRPRAAPRRCVCIARSDRRSRRFRSHRAGDQITSLPTASASIIVQSMYFIDDTACNLAILNLVKFLQRRRQLRCATLCACSARLDDDTRDLRHDGPDAVAQDR